MRNYSSIYYTLGSRQSSAETGGQAVKTDFRSRSKGQGQFLTVKNLDRGRGRTYGECLSDHPLLCPVVSLPTNFCLSSEIQSVLLGITTPKPEQEKAILQFLLGRDVFVALPTGYGIACATSFYRWNLTESGI